MKKGRSLSPTLAALLCICLCMGLMPAAVAETVQLPLTTAPVTFTVWISLGTVNPQIGIKDLNDVLIWQELEKRTGVHIEWIHPTAGQEQESFNLMISSGDYPDMIIEYNAYSAGLDQGIEDGVFLRLNELIDQFAPHYAELRARNGDVTRGTITDSGNLGGMYSVNTPIQGPWYGPAVRKDWLDELGLDIPVTYDDWYTMLKAFKTEKGAEAPLWLHNRGGDMFSSLAAGYGVASLGTGSTSAFFQIDGTVKYSPLEEGYREYISMLAKWYGEGLIDPDYYTRRDYFVPDSLANTGKSGAFTDIYVMVPYRVYSAEDPAMNEVAVPLPVKTAGEKAHLRQYNFEVGNAKATVTTACKNPELAVKWLDYMCSDEGSLLMAYGVEGVTYSLVDGKPMPSALILANPDGLSAADARTKYLGGMYPGKYYWERELAGLPQKGLDAINTIWPDSADGAYVMPPVTMTAEEGTAFSRIMGDVDTYAVEMTTKFILGAEPLENFDQFVATLKAMGAEDAVAIQQAALERYLAR